MLKYSLAAILLTGCGVTVKLENSARLMARPDFEAAVLGSDAWVTEALQTINRLEQQLEAGN